MKFRNLIPILSLIICLGLYTQKVQGQIATINDCIQFFDQIIKKTDRRKLFKILLRVPTDFRLKALSLRGQLIKNVEGRQTIVQAYVDELNFAVRQGYISESQATEIIKQSSLTSVQQYFSHNGQIEFRLVKDQYVSQRLQQIKKNILESGHASSANLDAAFQEAHFLNLRYDHDTLDKVFQQIEQAFINTYADSSNAATNRLVNYLKFLSYQSERDFIQGLREINTISLVGKQQGQLVQKFSKIQAQVEKYHAKLLGNKKLAKKQGNAHALEVSSKARRFEELNYACKTSKSTTERQLAAKNFTTFSVGLGLVSASSFFTYQHWDKKKDGQWYGKLSFEVTTAIILSWVRSKIFSTQNSKLDEFFKAYFGNNWVSTSLQIYGTDSALKYGSAALYASLFGVSEKEAEEQIKQHFDTPEKLQAVEKLYEIMEKYKLHERYAEAMTKISQAYTDGQINQELFDDEEVKEYMLQAMVQLEYDQTKGVLSTGSHQHDLYVFDRLWFLQSTPRGLAVSYLIYRTLCMGTDTPISAFTKAFAISAMERVVVDPIYFKLRAWATGI